jgi:hypothetical protein
LQAAEGEEIIAAADVVVHFAVYKEKENIIQYQIRCEIEL